MRHSTNPEGRGHHRRGGKRALDHGALHLIVLGLIADAPRHGYEIITELEARSAGGYRPSPGVIYPTLTRLQAEGLITAEETGGKRKLCSITDTGRAYLAANAGKLTDASKGIRGGRHNAPPEIREAMDGLKSAMRDRFANNPDPAGIPAVAAILRDAATAIRSLEKTERPEPQLNQIITRHRHELKRRALSVAAIERLTPHMIRVVLEGADLEGFTSLGFDDHIKLFFPTGGERPEMRDYTPRAYDPVTKRLTVDFAVHDAGPATQWALEANIGTALQIGGPKGSSVIAPVFDWYLLVGDETALPAMGRCVEELGAGTKVITVAAVVDDSEHQHFDTKADHTAHWVYRGTDQAADPAPLVDALANLSLPEGRGFIWIAAEASVARTIKSQMINDQKHPKEWLKASGYWVKGEADAHAKLDD